MANREAKTHANIYPTWKNLPCRGANTQAKICPIWNLLLNLENSQGFVTKPLISHPKLGRKRLWKVAGTGQITIRKSSHASLRPKLSIFWCSGEISGRSNQQSKVWLAILKWKINIYLARVLWSTTLAIYSSSLLTSTLIRQELWRRTQSRCKSQGGLLWPALATLAQTVNPEKAALLQRSKITQSHSRTSILHIAKQLKLC